MGDLKSRLLGINPRHIRRLQVSLLLAVTAMGLTSGMLVGNVTSHFHDNCLLYGLLNLDRASPALHHLDRAPPDLAATAGDSGVGKDGLGVVVVEDGSSWGSDETCQFVVFEGIVDSILCFVWLWFYLHFDHKVGLSRNPMLIVPPVVVNFLLCLASFTRAATITHGMQVFCHNLCINGTEQHGCHTVADDCGKFQDSYWVLQTHADPLKPFSYYHIMTAAVAISWLEPLCLAVYVVSVVVDTFLFANPPPDVPALGPGLQSASSHDNDSDSLGDLDGSDVGWDETDGLHHGSYHGSEAMIPTKGSSRRLK